MCRRRTCASVVEAFVQSALRDVKDHHGQAARVAQRFGLACAAGEFGVQLGLLPWEQSDPLNDATELFKVWMVERGGAAPYEARQAIAQVRLLKCTAMSASMTSYTRPRSEARGESAGFRRDHCEARRWLIPPEVWGNEICAGLNPRETAKTLAGLHMLVFRPIVRAGRQRDLSV
jgi:hypothetical protein